MTDAPQAAASQTLSRGLTALEVLADADAPLTIGELTARLGLHRSITYRIVRTLEDHGLVVRNPAGELELGARLAALARNVSRDLQSAALPELTAVANELGMTAFIAMIDGDYEEAVTLASVEPRHAGATVAQRPGSRHPIELGAPGRAIGRLLRSGEPAGGADADKASARSVRAASASVLSSVVAASPRSSALATPSTSYETSHDEVIQGLSSIAVPLAVPGQHPASVAVVYLTQPVDVEAIGARLEQAARAIRAELA